MIREAPALPTQEQVIERAYEALSKAWEEWYAIEDRIAKGKVYMEQHPHDAPARSLLTRLEAQAATARERWEMAETTYKAVQP